jgi:hypothetical protein
MSLSWQNYYSDLGVVYPFVSVRIKQLSDIYRQEPVLDILPTSDRQQLITLNNSLSIPGLEQRKIKILFSDDTYYEFNYYKPFDSSLYQWLTSSIQIRGLEFIGEKIKHNRLTNILRRG